MWYLCSGKTWAKPSARSMASASGPASSTDAPAKPEASRISPPSPTRRPISRAMASWSPVIILTRMPSAAALASVSFESSRGGSRRGTRPRKRKGPASPCARATPSERKPRAANAESASVTRGASAAPSSESARITCGAPFETRKTSPSGPRTVASVRLPTGSKGVKWITSPPMPPFAPERTARSIGSSSSARDASAAHPRISSAETPGAVNGSPSVRRFWVSVPVLSEQSTSIPASSSMLASLATTASLRASRRAPTAIVTESTVGIATGMAATVRMSENCSVVTIASPRNSATPRIRMTSARASAMR